MTQEKYVPVRKCIACRQIKPQKELLRVAAGREGLVFDPERKLPGRGCYVCREEACIKTAFEKNCFARTFKKRIPPEQLAALRENIEKNI